jgi:predicted DNA-binding protein
MHDENIDILHIDHIIQTNFETGNANKYLESNISTYLQDTNLSSEFKKKIETWNTISSESNSIQMKNFYLLDTVELIQEYKQTLNTPIKVCFLDNIQKETSEENNSEKTNIIQKYIEKVKDYNILDKTPTKTDINVNNQISKYQKCFKCESQNLTESVDYSGIIICIDCGSQETTMNLANSIRLNHNDSKRINMCSKYSYDKKSHFLNCINQFQGKHKTGIDPEVIELIEKEIEKYKLVDNTKKSRKAKYKNVTKEHIFLFVKELRLTKCYGDINLIHNIITENPLNDISHLTEKLLQDFDQFVQTHHKLYSNELEKKNFNYQHLLYQLLVRHKYICNPSEFNFLKTIDRKYYHDEICRTIFETLGWNYSSFF